MYKWHLSPAPVHCSDRSAGSSRAARAEADKAGVQEGGSPDYAREGGWHWLTSSPSPRVSSDRSAGSSGAARAQRVESSVQARRSLSYAQGGGGGVRMFSDRSHLSVLTPWWAHRLSQSSRSRESCRWWSCSRGNWGPRRYLWRSSHSQYPELSPTHIDILPENYLFFPKFGGISNHA